MNYSIIFALLLVAAPLIAMDKNGSEAQRKSEATQRAEFKKLFFPDIPTPTWQDLLNACRFYNAIPADLEIVPEVTFEGAKKYAHFHHDKISAIFMRFSNALMVKTYKAGLSKEERDRALKSAALSIADDESLLGYILTGDNTKKCTTDEIWNRAIVFAKLVNSYRSGSEIEKPEKVLTG